jgi:hypothetical protein
MRSARRRGAIRNSNGHGGAAADDRGGPRHSGRSCGRAQKALRGSRTRITDVPDKAAMRLRARESSGIEFSSDGGNRSGRLRLYFSTRNVTRSGVYLRAYERVSEARSSIGRYLDFYNRRRPHSSTDDRTSDQAYFDLPPLCAAA